MIRNWITWNAKYPEQIDAVLCKGCGTIIRSLVVHDQFTSVQRKAEQTIIRERLTMANTPLYTEVEIVMEDGSTHITSACLACAEKATDDELEHWYEADLDMMDEENRRAKVKGASTERLRARKLKKKDT